MALLSGQVDVSQRVRPKNGSLKLQSLGRIFSYGGAKFYKSLRRGIFDVFIVRSGRASGIR